MLDKKNKKDVIVPAAKETTAGLSTKEVAAKLRRAILDGPLDSSFTIPKSNATEDVSDLLDVWWHLQQTFS